MTKLTRSLIAIGIGVVFYLFMTWLLYYAADLGHGFRVELFSPFRLCFFLPLDIGWGYYLIRKLR